MRTVMVNNIVSLDGFFADEQGNPLALNRDESFDAYNREQISRAGALLLGRSSYEGFASYWRFVADAVDDPTNRALSADNREVSHLYNLLPKTVVSDSYRVPAEHPGLRRRV